MIEVGDGGAEESDEVKIMKKKTVMEEIKVM